MNNDLQTIQEQIDRLNREVGALKGTVNKNNYSSEQIFNKRGNFTTKLKVPSYGTLPNCEVGEIGESGGVLYICSATNTWTVVGTQS